MLPAEYGAFVATLESEGEVGVRARFEAGRWAGRAPETHRIVSEWLAQKKMDREMMALTIARRAAEAAERSTAAAERSARISMLSAFIALATVAVTVLMGGFLAWLFG